MSVRVSARFSSFAIAITALYAIGASPALSRDAVAETDMPRYCQGEAASAYSQNPQDITTTAAERRKSGAYVVAGQFPPTGDNLTKFTCRFNKSGLFIDVRLAGEKAAEKEPVAETDMGRFCQGEAAEAFDQNPQDILTLPVEKKENGVRFVFGQYPPQGANVTTFRCRFNQRGAFMDVERQ
jgi:uncharacterized protein YukE